MKFKNTSFMGVLLGVVVLSVIFGLSLFYSCTEDSEIYVGATVGTEIDNVPIDVGIEVQVKDLVAVPDSCLEATTDTLEQLPTQIPSKPQKELIQPKNKLRRSSSLSPSQRLQYQYEQAQEIGVRFDGVELEIPYRCCIIGLD